jgi:hypothetical protein
VGLEKRGRARLLGMSLTTVQDIELDRRRITMGWLTDFQHGYRMARGVEQYL